MLKVKLKVKAKVGCLVVLFGNLVVLVCMYLVGWLAGCDRLEAS